ncbi:MAG: LptF/LptG family permease [Caulobacterales bacterium]
MSSLQRYFFWQCVWPTLAIFVGLMSMAVLSQGLSSLNLIVEQRATGLTYLLVTMLATPQVIGLLLPLATFFGILFAINRLQNESEIAAAFAAGLSRWALVAPILRLATIVAILHLANNLWVQPIAYRNMRVIVNEARADLAAAFVRQGTFTSPKPGLTFYIGESRADGRLFDVFVNDDRRGKEPATYTAREGRLAEIDGKAAMIMFEGSVQRRDKNGDLAFLSFDQYVLDLSSFFDQDQDLVLEASDRFIPELLRPDPNYYYDQQVKGELIAEGHSRMAAPLVNFGLASIAVLALVGGEFSRRGYGQRIAIAAGIGIVVRVTAIALQSAARDDAALNVVQYLFPIVITAFTLTLLLIGRKRKGRHQRVPLDPASA